MAASKPRQHALVGQVIGGYEITGFVGYGKLGTVLEAIRPGTSQRVAVKVLRADLTAGSNRASVVDGLERLTQTRHPNLMPIEHVGQLRSGEIFYVMPLMPPLTLRELIARHAPLKVRRTRKILQQLTSALAAAHSSLVFHGRLEPACVYVEPSLQSRHPDRVVLGTFGLTGPERRLGAYQYQPPEVADPSHDSTRRTSRAAADIYAVGCMAVEMLTGKPPLLADTRHGTVMRRLQKDFVWPRDLATTLPHALVDTVNKTLLRHAAKRTASIFDVLRGFKAGTVAQLPAAPPKPPHIRKASLKTRGAPRDKPASAARSRVLGRGRLLLVAGKPCLLQVLQANPGWFKVRAYLQGQTLSIGAPVTLTFPSPANRDGVALSCRVTGEVRHYSRGVSEFHAELTAPPTDAAAFEALLARWGTTT